MQFIVSALTERLSRISSACIILIVSLGSEVKAPRSDLGWTTTALCATLRSQGFLNPAAKLHIFRFRTRVHDSVFHGCFY